VFAGKPIIGIVGGIGSGKSFIAALFAAAGCLVIAADEQVRALYADPDVREILRSWWGDGVFNSLGEVDKRFIAQRVFADPAEKQRLEALLHPRVVAMRQAVMAAHATDPQVVAYVWDTPLLFEAGHAPECDAIVFVESSIESRLDRVLKTRKWEETELLRREKLQWPLDNKRRMSNYILQNTADVGFAAKQVQEILSRILAGGTRAAQRKADPPSQNS